MTHIIRFFHVFGFLNSIICCQFRSGQTVFWARIKSFSLDSVVLDPCDSTYCVKKKKK